MWSSLTLKNRLDRPAFESVVLLWGNFFLPSLSFHLCHSQPTNPILLDVTCSVRLHTLLHVIVCCWELLCNVWNQLNFLPHANRRNIVNCCVRLHIALSVSCGVSKEFSRLCSGELCMLRHNNSYRESYFFALNQKDIIFLKNLFGTKRTDSVHSDTILYHKLIRFFPPLFLQLGTFSLWY